MSGLTAFKSDTRQIREFIIDCLLANLTAFVQGSPGIGKSAIVKSIAEEFNLCLIDHRLSTSAPEDLSGLPHFRDGKASFLPFDIFPIEGAILPINPKTGKQYDGWLLFLDEFNSAAKSVQAAAYKLILDREVGQSKLHERVKIVTAGNLASDRAIVNPLSTAMQSRVVHLEMEVQMDHWLEDVAFKQDYDPRITAYIMFKPENLMNFRPDHNEKTFCCPRTWEFMNRLIKGKTYALTKDSSGREVYEMENKAALFAGTITSGIATEFIQFTKIFEHLPKIADIIKDPKNTPVPKGRDVQFAVISHCLSYVDEKNFEAISEYLNQMTAEFRVYFFRGAITKTPAIRTTKAFGKMVQELAEYLNG